jgi:hypothetical protein
VTTRSRSWSMSRGGSLKGCPPSNAALAALFLERYVHGKQGHVRQEARPWAGIAIIGGLLAFHILLPPVGHHFGIEFGGHGAAPAHGASTPAVAPCGHCGPACFWGALAGWFVGVMVNAVLGAWASPLTWWQSARSGFLLGSSYTRLLRRLLHANLEPLRSRPLLVVNQHLHCVVGQVAKAAFYQGACLRLPQGRMPFLHHGTPGRGRLASKSRASKHP